VSEGSLLDTSILVAGAGSNVLSEPWAISMVTVGELEHGVLSATDAAVRARRLAQLAAVLSRAPALAVDRRVAARYGELRNASGRQPSNDLWIAATALAHDFTLVTADALQAALPLVRSRLIATAAP
jgi:predicted nucleic acid-binding protein